MRALIGLLGGAAAAILLAGCAVDATESDEPVEAAVAEEPVRVYGAEKVGPRDICQTGLWKWVDGKKIWVPVFCVEGWQDPSDPAPALKGKEETVVDPEPYAEEIPGE